MCSLDLTITWVVGDFEEVGVSFAVKVTVSLL